MSSLLFSVLICIACHAHSRSRAARIIPISNRRNCSNTFAITTSQKKGTPRFTSYSRATETPHNCKKFMDVEPFSIFFGVPSVKYRVVLLQRRGSVAQPAACSGVAIIMPAAGLLWEPAAPNGRRGNEKPMITINTGEHVGLCVEFLPPSSL